MPYAKEILQRSGAGRLVYFGWHRPRAFLATLARAGGPLEHWRTVRGRRAMTDTARQLPPLPIAPANAPALHLLTGRRLWSQTVFFLHSLQPYLAVRPFIHDDGQLDPTTRDELLRALPGATLIGDDDSRDLLDTHLPASRFPTLRARREDLVLFRKILDVHAGRSGWTLFCDSDMLVYRRPAQLIDWLAAPQTCLHMVDATRAYGYDLAVLEQLAGRPVPDLVNTGLLGLGSDAIDWARLEWYCRTLIERHGTHYYQEQALIALHLAAQPHAALAARDYLVLPDATEARNPTAVLHHYVADSKRWYFRENWRRFAPTA